MRKLKTPLSRVFHVALRRLSRINIYPHSLPFPKHTHPIPRESSSSCAVCLSPFLQWYSGYLSFSACKSVGYWSRRQSDPFPISQVASLLQVERSRHRRYALLFPLLIHVSSISARFRQSVYPIPSHLLTPSSHTSDLLNLCCVAILFLTSYPEPSLFLFHPMCSVSDLAIDRRI